MRALLFGTLPYGTLSLWHAVVRCAHICMTTSRQGLDNCPHACYLYPIYAGASAISSTRWGIQRRPPAYCSQQGTVPPRQRLAT